MSVPPIANGFPYDIYSYNYQMAAAAAATQTNYANTPMQVTPHMKGEKDSPRDYNRDRERSIERHDSSSRDREHRSMFGSQVDHDKPPFSRVFVVCGKSHSSDNLRTAFEEFGTVEDVWVVKDKHTKENRGVAYIKFSKMSEACLAIEKMDGKKLSEDDEQKPLKVIIAQPKSSKSTEDFSDESALTRLFVVIPKGMDEKDLRTGFEEFGDIDYVQVVKDRKTGEKKGFGYVKYRKAFSAAKAVENCDKSYKAVMAEPKSSKIKRELAQSSDNFGLNNATGSIGSGLELALGLNNSSSRIDLTNCIPAQGFGINFQDNRSAAIGNRLVVQVAQNISQEQLARLFDLIPGMELCDLKKNYSTGESKGVAVVVYNSVGSAIYAKEKLNGFEYPPGCKLIVRYAPDDDESLSNSRPHTADVSQTSQSGNNTVYCSAQLPSPKPMTDSENCAERLFIVCHPSPPPDNVLKDIFSRFGGLIDVFMLRNKNFGYAKYSSIEAAENAIQILHGAEVLGKKLKVLQAEPPKSSESTRKRPRT